MTEIKEQKPLTGRTILIVEDDRFISRVYAKWLTLAGAEPIIANDGALGLRTLEERPVDIVFLDLGMPGLNGHDMLLEIRKNKKIKDVPVVILSNTTIAKGQDLYNELQEAGVSDILRKYETSLKQIVSCATSALEKNH